MVGKLMGALFDFVGGALNMAWSSSTERERATRALMGDDVECPPMPGFAGEPSASPSPTLAIDRVQTQIDSLKKIDPNFSDVSLLSQASQTYLAVLGAQNAMSAEPLGALATPNCVSKLSDQIASWRSGGFERHTSDIKIDNAKITGVSVDGTSQSIQVRFTGTGVRYTKDTMAGVITEGSAQNASFTEFGTFVRPAGTTTPAAIGAGAPARCSGCGAPQESGALKCPYCGTVVTGSGGAWLLDKISASAYT